MRTKIKYNLQGWGRGLCNYRGRSYMSLKCLYKGTFLTLEKAEKKFEELKTSDIRITELKLIELNPEGGHYSRTGRQASSGYYYTESHEVFNYDTNEIKNWRRE